MRHLTQSLKHRLYHNRFGLFTFGCLSLITAAVLATSVNIPDLIPPINQSGAVTVNAQLSQTKVAQGEQSTLYLDVKLKAPRLETAQAEQRASDIIVILDRSGSMGGENKMTYAKAAIRDLLSRLNQQDRFALVSFSNHAIVHAPLAYVDASRREQLLSTLNNIQVGGGTNIGDGLTRTVQLLLTNEQNRASKVILLSDGQVNEGITDLAGLSHIVAKITQQESVLSSIGMGLDFNETLMSSLADYGMGSYAYLENLAGLGDLFAQSLNATRNIYAANSHLSIQLADGVTLIDAGGYPMSKSKDNTYTIKTGQLLNNRSKQFVMTFQVNAAETGAYSLGAMQLTYQAQGEHKQSIAAEKLNLAVVAAQHRKDAVASIDKAVYKRSWLKNNLGRMQKQLSTYVRDGNKAKADQVMTEYRQKLAKAEEAAAMPIMSNEVGAELQEMEDSIAESFRGNTVEKEKKRKRAAKSLQMNSVQSQRAIQ
ncbi:MAG: VWA domain-containing protein [Methyloprofundus sp.]|nr:VWA domain-containing protein [Methyloprofundus sp.]